MTSEDGYILSSDTLLDLDVNGELTVDKTSGSSVGLILKTTLTPAQINAFDLTSPTGGLQLIAAPGANLAIQVDAVWYTATAPPNFSPSTHYSTEPNIYVYYGTDPTSITAGFFPINGESGLGIATLQVNPGDSYCSAPLTLAVDFLTNPHPAPQLAVPTSSIINQPLSITGAAQSPKTGNIPVKVLVLYRIIDLS